MKKFMIHDEVIFLSCMDEIDRWNMKDERWKMKDKRWNIFMMYDKNIFGHMMWWMMKNARWSMQVWNILWCMMIWIRWKMIYGRWIIWMIQIIHTIYWRWMIKIYWRWMIQIIHKICWRWMIKIIHKIYWRWMVQIIEDYP